MYLLGVEWQYLCGVTKSCRALNFKIVTYMVDTIVDKFQSICRLHV